MKFATLMLAAVLAGCAAEAPAPDPEAGVPGVARGAGDLLVAAQGSGAREGRWEPKLGGGDTAPNSTGLIGTSLLLLYDATQEDVYLHAAGDAAEALLDELAGPRGAERPYSQDVEFLATAGHAREAAAWFARTREKFPLPARYTDYVIDGRVGSAAEGLAGWDIASAVRAALAVGEPRYAEGLLGRLLERYGDWDHGPSDDYVLMSYGSLLFAMGRMEEVAGDLPRSLVELGDAYRDALERAQFPGGGIPFKLEHTETADVQTTAYAALGLHFGPRDGARAAGAARDWLAEAAFSDDSTFVGGVAWAPSHRRADARPELPFEVEPEVVAEAVTALLAE